MIKEKNELAKLLNKAEKKQEIEKKAATEPLKNKSLITNKRQVHYADTNPIVDIHPKADSFNIF